MGTTFTPTMLELLTFGALIAATDTVSVLSVLQSKKVDPHLFYLVFGESALNDAVALVLFSTFSDFLKIAFNGTRNIAVDDFAFLLVFAAENIA
jgi:sodium/hydrogen exchanger 8